ncbi:MAG: type II toxin-antitoxin system Phd/YefM family antitoxin [Chloroflexi bacterium]|nr:type II toxin-antitoxin system Phd/YefM family antitoxin [Chloroflexota bacterium]MBV9599057.1 type II toxin-antitoxin system Phd/YefM family antitoxin [Chloroflexota bacterium]
MLEVTYFEAHTRFEELVHRVNANNEVVHIRHDSGVAAVLLAADEYARLIQTTHRRGSPANARRMLQALAAINSGPSSAPPMDPTATHAPASNNQPVSQLTSQLGDAFVKSWDETVRKLRRRHVSLESVEASRQLRATVADFVRSEVDELMTMMGIVLEDRATGGAPSDTSSSPKSPRL